MAHNSTRFVVIKDIINDLQKIYTSANRFNFLEQLYDAKLLKFYRQNEMPPRNIIITDNLRRVYERYNFKYITENEILIIIIYFDDIAYYKMESKWEGRQSETTKILKKHLNITTHNQQVENTYTYFSANIGMPDIWTKMSMYYSNANTFNILDMRPHASKIDGSDITAFEQDIEDFTVLFNNS